MEPVDEIAPEVDIWEDDDPMTWDAIVPIPEVPAEYTAEDDAIAAEGLMHSLYWAGAIE